MVAARTNNVHELKPMHPLKKFLLFFIVVFLLALSSFLFWVSTQYTVPILMYHEVDYAVKEAANTVSPGSFGLQMKYLYENNYNVISLDELVNAKLEKRKIPKNTVVITFDDGYENNYTNAFKILQKHDFPATIFIPSEYAGQEGFLNPAQIKAMQESGLIAFESHSQTHAYLPEMDFETLQREIFQSKEDLSRLLGKPVRYFAYPVGGFNEQIKQMVKEAGYKGAVATNRGYDKINKDLYELNRIRLSNNDTQSWTLWIKFSGYYNVLRSPKSPY